MTRKEQSDSELEVFSAFARHCPIGIKEDTIEKVEEEGFPDIKCILHGGEKLRFEVTEIIDRDVASQNAEVGDEFDLPKIVSDLADDKKAQLTELHRQASFLVVLDPKSTRNQRRNGAAALVDYLVSDELTLMHLIPGGGGVFLPPNARRYRGVRNVYVRRCLGEGPHFEVSAGGAFGIPAAEAVRKKLTHVYEVDCTMELLAFFDSQPRMADDPWLADVERVVRDELDKSQFSRVWVYDHRESAVVFVHPSN